MATNYVSVGNPGGTRTGTGDDGTRQSSRRTNNCNDNSIHQSHHLPPRNHVGAQQATTTISDQPSSDSELYASRTHNEEPIGQLYEWESVRAHTESVLDLQTVRLTACADKRAVLEESTLLTPEQEKYVDSEGQGVSLSSLSLLRTEHPEQDTLLQSSLKPFTSLVEPYDYLFSPPLSPRDRSCSHKLNC